MKKFRHLSFSATNNNSIVVARGLRVTGIPETDNNLEDEILKITNTNMSLSPPITREDISRCHRVGAKTTTNTKRAILIKFSTYRVRARVMAARKHLKNTNIYVTEDLTQTRATLAFKAREAKRSKTIHDTWTYDGKIIIKTLDSKIAEVKNVLELNKITGRPA